MSASVKVLVQLGLDGKTYQPGEWVTLPDEQKWRAQELVAYGLAEEAPARPVKAARRRAASG
ncbi:hypothetical protein QFZ75_008067 [Streptomyces sp. V3I8]|uniref:hypothetical protein n=1 Tax=Streptomyces sp. V3I8 TaxID=3042279 RepID=UPI002786C2EE|nr:hypothetical protein [Streptomyces sp. V3I8]MDQ1041565.1 hypothetical protein [Streptomyces sp. V3I8]